MGPGRFEAELPRASRSAKLARDLLSKRFDGSLQAQELEDARLLVSELAANAVQHGAGRIVLIADLNDDRLRIEVIDEGTGFAHTARNVPFQETRGRGLLLVDAISARWGIVEGTTHVWAEVEREGPRLEPAS